MHNRHMTLVGLMMTILNVKRNLVNSLMIYAPPTSDDGFYQRSYINSH